MNKIRGLGSVFLVCLFHGIGGCFIQADVTSQLTSLRKKLIDVKSDIGKYENNKISLEEI